MQSIVPCGSFKKESPDDIETDHVASVSITKIRYNDIFVKKKIWWRGIKRYHHDFEKDE